MKNEQALWCAICEVKRHSTTECQLNLKNRQNYQAIYQTSAVAQNNNADNNERNGNNDWNDINNNYQRYDGKIYDQWNNYIYRHEGFQALQQILELTTH